MVLGSEEFDLLQMESPVRSDQLGQVEHLEAVDFVSVEVRSEEAGVAVGSVEGLVDADVWQVTEVGVEGVVLSVGEVKVLSGVFVLSVFSQHSLENEEGVVVRVGPSWSLEEDTNVDVGHLVVSHRQHGGGEIWLIGILDLSGGGT